MTPERLNHLAIEEGLDLAGVAPAGPSPSWLRYREWVAAGYAGEMAYLARPDAVERRRDPRAIWPAAESVLVVAASYAGPPHPPLPRLHGRVARYAWGEPPFEAKAAADSRAAADGPATADSRIGQDYHRWLLRRVKALVRRIAAEVDREMDARVYVDTGPVLERAWAQAAGLGWTGKNACLIHPRLGSHLLLGVALLPVPLPPPPPLAMPTCGTCTRCIEACPTGAIVAPGVVDARRCLSYLTIEHRGPIPEILRPALGDRVFGCDICQEVCPWNRRPLAAHATEAAPPLATLSLPELLTLDADAFRARFRHTPLWRATPEGLARNAAVVLGNLHDPAARPALTRAAAAHPSALVRDHAAWALAPSV